MNRLIFIAFILFSAGVSGQQPVHYDTPFMQDYSVKYYSSESPEKIGSDRNGSIRILTRSGLQQPVNGHFLYPGSFIRDNFYRTAAQKKTGALALVNGQLVFADETHLFSQAWAGSLFIKTPFPKVSLMAGDEQLNFMVSDGRQLALLRDSRVIFNESHSADPVLDIRYHNGYFWVLKKTGVFRCSLATPRLTAVVQGRQFTAFDLSANGQTLLIGTSDGYLEYDLLSGRSETRTRVPVTEITAVKVIGDKAWFGTPQGAFSVQSDGTINYYYGERWLPSNDVTRIEKGPENSVLILTGKGLGQIHFKPMTLAEKADFFDRQVRSRHIRNGFNATLTGMEKGDPATGYLSDSDNDGLWTSMYLAGEAFRYSVTGSQQALENCRESLDAMERLYSINPVPGFPARSFERSGYIRVLADPNRWQNAADPEWSWKSTTSSDEAIGHMFVFGVLAELVNDPGIRGKAILLMDTLMSHILKNDLYLVDYDGKPTLWGKWNPSYVNGFPENVGDRKLNSSNITAMLQTAYHFTGKEKYRAKALELLYRHGYLDNLMRPMKTIGVTPEGGDSYAQMLSEAWNHSDDEMYFLGYWGLFRYALNDTLKAAYRESILDHWEAERPEKDGLWNFFAALTGSRQFDLENAIWYLQEHPLDLIQWEVRNSHRKDIEKIPDNFRRQTLKTVLPPDERPVQRHNANMFILEKEKGNGVSELSAGDIWLLPYWMGRYLGVISP
ncbi:hypothetical protein [Leadbetterella sp. DM7]|uniref:hypothetical protein n=1 Tax=Leadbetterella sp. DM7 TaxID=3235085 RepID=UPI00349E88D5